MSMTTLSSIYYSLIPYNPPPHALVHYLALQSGEESHSLYEAQVSVSHEAVWTVTEIMDLHASFPVSHVTFMSLTPLVLCKLSS